MAGPRITNPQVISLIEMLKAATPPGTPRTWEVDPDQARAGADKFFAVLNAGGPAVAETRAVTVPGPRGEVPAVLYVPHGGAAISPGLLYIHGGGWVIGSPATHDRLSRELASGIGARVLSVHYGLAPEAPFPAGLDDCVAAARWLGEHGPSLGIDPDRLLIGGDSAGGNLAAATLLRLEEDDSETRFRAALLIYGAFAGNVDTPSRKEWGDTDLILSEKVMHWFYDHYTSPDPDPQHPHLAPLHGDLAGFPPSVLVCGTMDPLLSDSELFADALADAGVSAELHVVEEGIHAFVQMPALDMCGEAIATLCEFARRHVG